MFTAIVPSTVQITRKRQRNIKLFILIWWDDIFNIKNKSSNVSTLKNKFVKQVLKRHYSVVTTAM